MSTIVEFIKAHNTIKGQVVCNLTESVGPTDYESFCLFSTTGTTAPHIDIFPDMTEYGNIIISGNTKNYTIPVIQNADEKDFIEQYFLENPTVEGKVQYLIRVNNSDQNINHYHYDFITPGLVYSAEGKILGFLHSHITNDSTVEFEIPYKSTDTYTFTGATAIKKSGEDYIYLLSINSDNATVTVEAGGYSAQFNLYRNLGSNTNTYTIKDVNEYVNYAIASNSIGNQNIITIKNYFEAMEQLPSDLNAWHPVHFKSTYLWSFAETRENMTPSIYKVPAAFTTSGNKKVFMTDITGISANKIGTN